MSEHWVADDRPTWAEVDLDALAWNYRAVCERVGAGVKVMGVVKADAYGHGAPSARVGSRERARSGSAWRRRRRLSSFGARASSRRYSASEGSGRGRPRSV
jgi:hypothetical protein